MTNIVSLADVREQQFGKPARVSVSLKRLSRENRGLVLRAVPYTAFWLQTLQANHYRFFLQLQYVLRTEIEGLIDAVGAQFVVHNQFKPEPKLIDAAHYLPATLSKAPLIESDLNALCDKPATRPQTLPAAAERMIAYIRRSNDVYSAALLGILYALDEGLSRAAPRIAEGLSVRHAVPQNALRFLTSYAGSTADLWQFRNRLDGITDFQTQANIVIAATATLDMQRELFSPRSFRQNAIVESRNSH